MAKENKSSVLAEHDVQKLNDYQHSRIRTEMYLGSRVSIEQDVLIFDDNGFSVKRLEWVPALVTAFREIIDNSLDEFKKAKIKDAVLKVIYREDDLYFSISDNGRGIPIDYVPEFDMNLCTMVLTETKTGRNFNDSERNGVIGANGLGGSITMCVSSEADIEIHRSGKPNKKEKDNTYDGMYKFSQKFKEGNDFFPELLIEEPVIRKVKADKTGTTISFKLSPAVFKTRKLPVELVYSILKEIANANPNYKIYLNDKQIKTKESTEKTLFKGFKISTLEVKDEGLNSKFFIVPNAVPEGMHMHGIVNNAPSFEGGSHFDTFKRAFPLGLIKALEKESKKRKLKPNRSDIEEGLLIYNITEMNAPYFSSQTKSKLINDNVTKPIERDLNDDFYAEVIKKNKQWIDEIYERCSQRTNKKEADEDRKAAKKLLRSKVLKLIDAGEKFDRSKCKLLIAEGDCLYEDQEISVFSTGKLVNTKIKDVIPGDIVLTHNSKLREVQAISSKVHDTITFSTSYGDITCTPEHRMLVMRDNEVLEVEAKDILSTDQFIRNKLVDVCEIHEIDSIESIDDEKYDYLIKFGENEVKSSATHKFTVYNSKTSKYEDVECKDLNILLHSISITMK